MKGFWLSSTNGYLFRWDRSLAFRTQMGFWILSGDQLWPPGLVSHCADGWGSLVTAVNRTTWRAPRRHLWFWVQLRKESVQAACSAPHLHVMGLHRGSGMNLPQGFVALESFCTVNLLSISISIYENTHKKNSYVICENMGTNISWVSIQFWLMPSTGPQDSDAFPWQSPLWLFISKFFSICWWSYFVFNVQCCVVSVLAFDVLYRLSEIVGSGLYPLSFRLVWLRFR